jgi:hypothetical protein
MSHIKTLKITPTCFDHQMIIIRELLTCQRLIVRFTGVPLEKSVTSSRDRKLTFQYGRCN